jgi:Uma2 family endonuclease
MASVPSRQPRPDIDYPDSDGKPMGETPRHRQNLTDLVQMLEAWLAENPMAYVSGNMMMYYEPGNRRRHVSPDVFVALGVPKVREPERRSYLVWLDKAPDLVIELTSASTRREDMEDKFRLYRDVLRVQEYFLFDPYAEYLEPPLQGYRLRRGRYGRIRPAQGRLPSKLVGLHLERAGPQLRLYDPTSGQWLPTPQENADAAQERADAAQQRAEVERQRADAAQQRAEAATRQAEDEKRQAEEARRRAEAEVESLRRELEALRRRSSEGDQGPLPPRD